MIQRIMIRISFASSWLDKIEMNNSMAFQKIIVAAPNFQRGNRKAQSKSRMRLSSLFSGETKKSRQEARATAGAQIRSGRFTDYLRVNDVKKWTAHYTLTRKSRNRQ